MLLDDTKDGKATRRGGQVYIHKFAQINTVRASTIIIAAVQLHVTIFNNLSNHLSFFHIYFYLKIYFQFEQIDDLILINKYANMR